jgi:hypothetical protein
MDEPQRYFFMHIPKTAGMALYQRLIHHHGEDAVYPQRTDRGRPGTYMNVDYLVERFRKHPEIRVIAGHFPLCIEEVLDVRRLTTFTVLRDPVERALSMLRQHQQQDEEFRKSSLDDVYSDPVLLHGLIHNYTVKVLTMTVAEMQDGVMTMVPYDDERLDHAERNLEHRIKAFGLQEEFDDFCGRLAHRFGWDLGPGATYSNRTSPADVSNELRERIAHDNALDVRLFEFAKALLRQRRTASTSASLNETSNW